MNKQKKKQISKKNPSSNRKKLPIGQTMETADKFLPLNKKTSKKLKESRPVIIVDKIINPEGVEEYAVVPGSNEKTKNTSPYNKHGITNYRHNLEIVDNENKPIQLNNKYRVTKNSTRLSKLDAEKIYDNVVNHTKMSSENRKKQEAFKNRYKKKK